MKEEATRSIARALAVSVTRSGAPLRVTENEPAYMFWFRAEQAISAAPTPENLEFAIALAESALTLLFFAGEANAAEAERRLRLAMRINPIYDWQAPNFLAIALYEQGRYAGSVNRFDEAARLNPGFVGNIMWNAAAHAQASRMDRARELAADLMARAPTWSIATNFVQIRDPATQARLDAGLRRAGLPER